MRGGWGQNFRGLARKMTECVALRGGSPIIIRRNSKRWFSEKSVKMQLAPISTKLKSSHHIPERRLYAKFQGPSSKNDRVVRWPRRQPYYYLGYIVKVGWACSAGSNGPVDPPYHLGPLIEWYLHGFRGFGGVWGGLGSIPSDFGPTGLIRWTPDLGLSEVEKSTSSDLYET